MQKKAINVHEDFAGYLAFENRIMWDAYTPSQFFLFKQKLDKLYQNVGNCSLERKRAIAEARDAIYKSTIAQAKYTNKNLLSTFILVTVAEGDTFLKARDATKFSVHLVVRTRRCMKNDDSDKCCMVFIDELGRVYQNWQSYIEDNLLPDGIAFAPSKGCYLYKNGKLNMESWPTPASTSVSKVVAKTDIAASVGAVAAAGIAIATLAVPVAAPLIAASNFLGASTGVYTAVRSGLQLRNRSVHEQSTGLTDRQSRECWFGITTGALAASCVANNVIKSVAVNGRKFTLLEETVVKGMNVASMLLSGTGVVNGVVYIIIKLSDDQKTTPTDWFEIVSFLAIFTHSVYNYRVASNIMSQSRSLRSRLFQSNLREMFKKITISTTSTHGNIDLIRLTNIIPDDYRKVVDTIQIACRLYSVFEPFILSKDNFNDCIQSLCNVLDQKVTEYLVNKANEFLRKFRAVVEKFIKTTLFLETALWDLYQKCEEYLIEITIRNLDANIEQIFKLLLEHYKKMTWKSSDSVYKCKQCNGLYSVTKLP